MQRVTRKLKDLQQGNLDDSAAAKILATISALFTWQLFIVSFHSFPLLSLSPLFASSSLSPGHELDGSRELITGPSRASLK
jgi:hypothetical protein